MSNCHYCNGIGYESIKVEKYDSAMKEHYETYENRMCINCGGKGYYPEVQVSSKQNSTEVMQKPQASNSTTKIKDKKPDVSGGAIANISIVLAVIVAYFTYHNPAIELNWLASLVIMFITSNIVLHIVYGIFVAMTKLAEIVLVISFWGAIITGISYVSGAQWRKILLALFRPKFKGELK